MDTASIGFNADVKSKTELNVGEAFKHALPQDFVKFGLIPEFIGRVPITVSLEALDRLSLIHIYKGAEYGCYNLGNYLRSCFLH